ncbi:MAG: putative quinol monooxygenase [Actinomycetota bacterium]|nr:putative quinol monooxygenase [Actinomycetota bacterium]
MAGSLIVVTGSVTARAGALDEVVRLGLEHVHRSRLEPGCLLHSMHRDLEHPNRVVFLEHWADAHALRAHFRVPESHAFVEAVTALADEPPTIEIYEATRTSL